MKATTLKLFRWWHIVFGVMALLFAGRYLQDGLGEGGATGDLIHGGVWVAVALLMIVPEFFHRKK